MKAYLLAAVFLFASIGHASLTNWDVDISVNDDGSSDWKVVLTYNETVQQSDYFILSRISDAQIFANNQTASCRVTQDIGTSIVCTTPAAQYTYRFRADRLVDNLQNFKAFRYPFSVTSNVDRISIVVKMPLAAVLAEQEKLSGTGLRSFEPQSGAEGSDGRRIFISWVFDNPTLGQTINISVIYELISGFEQFAVFAVILAAVVIGFILAIVFVFRRRTIRDMLPILNDGERKAMEILLREKGEVDQRIIVKETDFSKAKVSRIIGDLVDRGLVEKIIKGRKNLIKLKKHIKQAERKIENKTDKNRV